MINLTDDTTIHVFEGVKLMDIYDKTTGFPRLDNALRHDGADRDGDILNTHYHIESLEDGPDRDWAIKRNREIELEIKELREILDYNGTKLKPERVEEIEGEIESLLRTRDENTFKYRLAGKRFDELYFKKTGVYKPVVTADDESRFRFITEEMVTLYSKKNTDYGDAFTQSLDEDGLLVSKIRMGDKFKRFSQLIKNDALVDDETMRDTLIDLANYTVMTLMWLDENE